MGVDINSIYCTKIASKLVRTYTDYHGLKHVTRELLGIELSKEQQSSDWAAEKLSGDQLKYAAMDVLNDREKDILTQRRLAEKAKTLEELSGQYDVSRERIRQIEVRAFEKLQTKMRELAQAKGMMASA